MKYIVCFNFSSCEYNMKAYTMKTERPLNHYTIAEKLPMQLSIVKNTYPTTYGNLEIEERNERDPNMTTKSFHSDRMPKFY